MINSIRKIKRYKKFVYNMDIMRYDTYVSTAIIISVDLRFGSEPPRSLSFGIYISQLILFVRVCSYVDDFNNRNLWTAKLLKQANQHHKIC